MHRYGQIFSGWKYRTSLPSNKLDEEAVLTKTESRHLIIFFDYVHEQRSDPMKSYLGLYETEEAHADCDADDNQVVIASTVPEQSSLDTRHPLSCHGMCQ